MYLGVRAATGYKSVAAALLSPLFIFSKYVYSWLIVCYYICSKTTAAKAEETTERLASLFGFTSRSARRQRTAQIARRRSGGVRDQNWPQLSNLDIAYMCVAALGL